MHHYEGKAGTERLVSLACADGDVCDFSGERGAERQVQRRNEATGYYWHCDIDGWWDSGFWHPYRYWHSVSACRSKLIRDDKLGPCESQFY